VLVLYLDLDLDLDSGKRRLERNPRRNPRSRGKFAKKVVESTSFQEVKANTTGIGFEKKADGENSKKKSKRNNKAEAG
jgi:hypothetical protein